MEVRAVRGQLLDKLLSGQQGQCLQAYRLRSGPEQGGQVLLQADGLLMLRHLSCNPLLLQWRHEDEVLLVFPAVSRSIHMLGQNWPCERQIALTGRQPVFMLLPAGCDILLVFMSRRFLQERFGPGDTEHFLGCAQRLQEGRALCPDQAWMASAVMENFVRLAVAAGQRCEPESRAALAELLCRLYWHVTSAFDAPALSPANHDRIVRQVVELVLRRPEAERTLDELCAVACCSRRTLANAFQDVLSLPPMKCVRRLRLNAFHRELRALAGNKELPLLLGKYGYANVGRLNAEYRELYGEGPRDTLHQRSGLHPPGPQA